MSAGLGAFSWRLVASLPRLLASLPRLLGRIFEPLPAAFPATMAGLRDRLKAIGVVAIQARTHRSYTFFRTLYFLPMCNCYARRLFQALLSMTTTHLLAPFILPITCTHVSPHSISKRTRLVVFQLRLRLWREVKCSEIVPAWGNAPSVEVEPLRW